MSSLLENVRGNLSHVTPRPALAGAPREEWRHGVQLMPGGEFAANDVAAFLADGLRHGAAAAVITSPARWDEILEAFERMGLDVTAFGASGTLSFLDGDRALDGCLRDGMPEPQLFERTIGAPLSSLCAGGRALRVYGDMVDVLWCSGCGEAALVLEDLWNRLLARLPARLLCGYSVEAFLGDDEGIGFRGVCSRHDQVEPIAPYDELPVADPGRLIAELQVSVTQARESVRRRQQAEENERQARQELEVAHQRLLEASRRKDDFLALLGHELRNPLAPIVTALEVLKLKLDPPSGGDSWPELGVIERQVMHLSRLVDDLLDLSRIAEGKLEIRKAEIELDSVLAPAVELASPLIERCRHTLTVEPASDRLRVEGDPVRLAQAIGNLLANAAKYTDEGGRIVLRARRDGDDAVIEVLDNGAGLAPEMLASIFEPFIQADRTVRRARGGLGVGLALVESVIARHGGSVCAESDGPGCGSLFRIRLPALPPVFESLDSLARDSPGVRTSLPRTVLIVDDNRDAADSLAALLRLLGHRVHVAYDGEEALAKAREVEVEMALLDINIPGMTGYEVARRLREQSNGRPMCFVAITGFGTAADRRRSRAAGFLDHLVKPIDHDRLLHLLAS